MPAGARCGPAQCDASARVSGLWRHPATTLGGRDPPTLLGERLESTALGRHCHRQAGLVEPAADFGVSAVLADAELRSTGFIAPLAAQGGREVRLQLSSDRAGPVLVEHAGCGNDGLTAYLETVDGAISDNTRRALRADITVFDVWCRRRGARAFPAGAATPAAFVDEMAGSRTPATVRRYVSSIAAVHRGLGAPAPHEAAAARVAVQRMHRRSGRR